MEKDYNEEYLEIIKYELGKLEFLIKTLVKSSRLESDIVVLQKTEVKLHRVVEEVISEFKNAVANKNINIVYNWEDFSLLLDKRWIKEAIHNLIDNGIKYSPENYTILISVYKSYINYNLDIENECYGLKEEDLGKLFKRFFRGKNSVQKDGLGLRLSISKEVIEKHGGSIKASLENGRIKFSVDLPF